MSGKFKVVKVYKDGYGNLYTTGAKDRIAHGWASTKNGKFLEVFDRKYIAQKQVDFRNKNTA